MPLAGLVAFAIATQSQRQAVSLSLVPSGMSRHMGGFQTLEVQLSTKKPNGLARTPAGITSPLYGTLRIGSSSFVIALGTVGKAKRLFVDSNADGDLTNDPPAIWRPASAQAPASGVAQVRLPFRGKRPLCNVVVVQHGAKMLDVIPDYGLSGHVALGGQSTAFYLLDRLAKGFADGKPDGATLGIDRKGTGVISDRAEMYPAELPFTVSRTSLVLQRIDLDNAVAVFVPGEDVAEVPLGEEFAITKAGPSFSTVTATGKPIHFPGDYSGHVVLIYVWATWSKPSLEWLPRVTQVYAKFKNLNFDVLGVCLNKSGEDSEVKTACASMPWTTAFDGKSWSSDTVKAMSLTTMPLCCSSMEPPARPSQR